MGAAANMADRMSQMESMDGAARCLETLRLQVSNAKDSSTKYYMVSKLVKLCNLISPSPFSLCLYLSIIFSCLTLIQL